MTDAYRIVLRIVHIGAAMLWFGGAIVSAFFLDPTAKALGPAGAPFMDHLMNRRRIGIYFPIVAGPTGGRSTDRGRQGVGGERRRAERGAARSARMGRASNEARQSD